MKISVDGIEILHLSETQKKVIMHDIPQEIFEQDMCRRLCYILTHKYEQCMKRLKEEWIPRLKENGMQSMPLDDEMLAEIIFSQPGYKDRSARELPNEKS